MEQSNFSFYKTLADTVKWHRKKTGLSREALAQYAGVGKTAIYDLEHAKETIQLSTLLKILAVLNIHIELSSPLLTQEKISHA